MIWRCTLPYKPPTFTFVDHLMMDICLRRDPLQSVCLGIHLGVLEMIRCFLEEYPPSEPMVLDHGFSYFMLIFGECATLDTHYTRYLHYCVLWFYWTLKMMRLMKKLASQMYQSFLACFGNLPKR